MSLFRTTPKHPLERIVFTDATVTSIRGEGPDAVLRFVDYCDSVVEIRFRRVSQMTVAAPVEGTELMAAAFEHRDKTWTITLEDDDGATIIEISYEDAAVTYPRGA